MSFGKADIILLTVRTILFQLCFIMYGVNFMKVLVRAAIIALLGSVAAGQSADDYTALDSLISAVDARMGAGTMQLSVTRATGDDFDIALENGQAATFGHRIAREVARHLEADQVRLTDFYRDTFKVELGDDPSGVSLVSYPLCKENHETLGATLRRPNGLTNKEIGHVNAFVGHANAARQALLTDPTDKLPALRTWTALGTCLAYAESLGDPDTSISRSRARQLLGDNFEKPGGVKFWVHPNKGT